jgi:hypothetical protein
MPILGDGSKNRYVYFSSFEQVAGAGFFGQLHHAPHVAFARRQHAHS